MIEVSKWNTDVHIIKIDHKLVAILSSYKWPVLSLVKTCIPKLWQYYQALTLSHLQTYSDAFAADDFWKHCGKRRKSWWAISLLPQCFQLYLENKISFMEIFHILQNYRKWEGLRNLNFAEECLVSSMSDKLLQRIKCCLE